MRTPPYFGTKSPNSTTGERIISLLPWEKESTYCELFAGMLGILVGRRPVACEIVNDLDNNITNWWEQVRDNGDELARMIALTPYSRTVLKSSAKIVQNPPADISPVRRALALHVVLEQGLHKRMASRTSWRLNVKPQSFKSVRRWTGDEVYPLANRLRDVQV